MATTPAKRPTLTQRLSDLSAKYEMTENNLQLVTEAMNNAVAMLRQEDVGWASPGAEAKVGLSLTDLQKWSREIRVSLTGTREKAPNPHMRNGLMLRHSFVWQGDIHYEALPGDPSKQAAGSRSSSAGQGKRNVYKVMHEGENGRLVFSKSSRRRREHALYADGLYLLVGKNSTKQLHPVPLHEITDTQRDELYEDEIVAYRWTRQEAERINGKLTGGRVEKSYWVYVDWYTGIKPASINYEGRHEKVLKDHTAFDLHANRPDGQAFGSPDAISAVVWARIIRDLIMNGVKMQDALAMFAFKATSKTKEGQQTQALELAAPAEAGSAAVAGGDSDFTALATAGRGYDFNSIGFIVATMAASLHISGISLSANTALAGSSYGAAKTLDLPGRMAMETRRAEHIEFEERLLKWLGAPDTTAYFDNYDDSTDEYRSVQAAYLMWQSGNLTPEGFRAELEIIYGRKLVGGIPQGVIVPNNVKQAEREAELAANTARAAASAKQAASPGQGQANGTGGSGHANDLPSADD